MSVVEKTKEIKVNIVLHIVSGGIRNILEEIKMNAKIMFYSGALFYILSFYIIYVGYQMGLPYFFASILIFLIWLIVHLYFMYIFKDEIFESNGWYNMSEDEELDEDE